jgi:hypothetical protein
MTRNVRNLGVLAVFAMALITFASAQEFAYRVQANIPVDFIAGDQHMAAGDYLFLVNGENHAVTIQNQATGKSLVVMASPIDYASSGYDRRNAGDVVELSSVGGSYVLSDIETRNNGVSFSQGASNQTSAKKTGSLKVVAALR